MRASDLFTKNKHIIWYGIALAVLLLLLKWLEFHFIIIDHAFEAYMSAVAVFFTTLGILARLKTC